MSESFPRALLIVVSAPSGAGKTSLCERLLARHGEIVYSVSCTTRPPRGREVHGVHYLFLSEEEFSARADRGEFLEHALVHGRRYGTLKHTVMTTIRNGQSVLMDIDVQGAGQIREAVRRAPDGDLLKSAFVDIFVEPPSMAALESRLRARGEDSEQEILRRLRNARAEMALRDAYRHRIVNEDLDGAYRELDRIVRSEQAITA